MMTDPQPVHVHRDRTGYGPIIILRCCRDWPVHLSHAYGGGLCGRCGMRPEVIHQEYRP